jgi:hypothetical protein
VPLRQPTIAETALQLIRARGPLTLGELAPLIVEAGRTRAKDPRRAVESAIGASHAFLEGPDDAWYSIVDQLEGAIFTVRPTDLERREGIVLVRDDLVLAASLLRQDLWGHRGGVHLDAFDDYFDLPPWDFDLDFDDLDEDGRPFRDPSRTVRAYVGDDRADDLLGFLEDIEGFRGPDEEAALRRLVERTAGLRVVHGTYEWMPDLEADQLLGLRIEAGEVHATAVDRRDAAGPHVDAAARRIAGIARRAIGPDASWFRPPVGIETLLGWVAIEAPELLRRPLPPIGDVIRRGGLALESGLVRHREFRRVA